MHYIVHYEICAAVFMLLLLVLNRIKKGFNTFQSKRYQTYYALVFVNICLDVITCYTIAYYEQVPVWLNFVLNSIFLVGQFTIPTMFMVYLHSMISKVRPVNPLMWKWAFLPPALGVFFVLINYWTKRIFYFDDTGYHHGDAHWYLYGNAVICAVGTIMYMWRARKYLKRHQCLMVVSVVIIGMLPTVIQYFMPSYMLTGVGTALSVYLIYTSNENVVDYIDQITGALNREALMFHISEFNNRRMPEQYFIIALDNFKMINEKYGIEGGNRLMQMVVSDLQETYSEQAVYRFGGDNFVVVIEERTEGAKELDRIRKVVYKQRLLGEELVELSACVGLVHSIHHGKENLIQAMEYAVTRAKQTGKGQFFEVEEDSVKDMLRKTAIEQALVAAVESGQFEVHYQPIYDTKGKNFHSMEALARLRVEGYGYVSPEEFIRIAEQNGIIIQVGLLVLEEVCKFISQYDLANKGIKFVEVNLSTVQCMQETIYQDITGILKRYDISPEMINLEITESAAAYSDDLLIKNMARISLTDITFSLDDYGSGYSNVNYLVDLPFSIVKIDKYLVWAAVKKVTSRRILENMIKMFKAIDLKVVAEGIEDMDMVQMLVDMEVDYLQGYHFSKPVPKELLVERLEKKYLEKIMGA